MDARNYCCTKTNLTLPSFSNFTRQPPLACSTDKTRPPPLLDCACRAASLAVKPGPPCPFSLLGDCVWLRGKKLSPPDRSSIFGLPKMGKAIATRGAARNAANATARIRVFVFMLSCNSLQMCAQNTCRQFGDGLSERRHGKAVLGKPEPKSRNEQDVKVSV